jgi:hypothetical protein
MLLMSWLLRGCLKRNRAAAILSLEVMNGLQSMKSEILIVSFAAVAIGAGMAGDRYGTPCLTHGSICALGPGSKCRPPIICTYVGIQGTRYLDGGSGKCPTVTFFPWLRSVPEPVVSQERTSEKTEETRREKLSLPYPP